MQCQVIKINKKYDIVNISLLMFKASYSGLRRSNSLKSPSNMNNSEPTLDNSTHLSPYS